MIFGIGVSFALTAFGANACQQGRFENHHSRHLGSHGFKQDVPAQHGLIGDAKLTLQALSSAMESYSKAPAELRANGRRTLRRSRPNGAARQPKLTSNDTPINPYRVIAELDRLRIKTMWSLLALAARDQTTPFWESTTPLSYIGWGKTTQLGYGLGLAMGAKLAAQKLCINVWGDAAIGFTGMDFETAVRENILILSILFNNFSMAIEIPIMPVSQEKYGRLKFPATTPTWRKPLAAMENG